MMTEENIVVKNSEEPKKIDVNEAVVESAVEESIEAVQVADIQIVEVGVESAFASLGNPNDMSVHNNLHDRDVPNAHPISAITNLRAELNALNTVKTPQTLYSDKNNVANYYEWHDGASAGHGYFVSLVPHTAKIAPCNGSDIFGVTVDSAGFIGNQNAAVPRGNAYALVVTSGLVDVRCESTVVEGDYVVSNADGIATKTDSCAGYKVIAIENKNGENYASVVLGIQACTTDLMDKNLQYLNERVGEAETNIVAAINMAQDAYNKATSAEGSVSASKKDVEEALREILGFGDQLDEVEKTVASANLLSAQAKAIAGNAVVSAESMRNEAVEKANEALDDTAKFRDELELMDEGITEIEDQITIMVKKDSEQGTAIAGIRTDVDDHGAKINNLVSWQGDTNTSMARIEQKADANGAYIQSTVANMDKYSVGPYSQSYGFTLDQAKLVLEVGMIYVPTVDHTEEQPSNRSFTKEYYYTWDGEKWVTSTSVAVTFADVYLTGNDNAPYWYIPGSNDVTSGGTTYNSHTLYKWESNQWVAVATLEGNTQSRAVSQIRQDANSIEAAVTTLDGKYAGTKTWVDENKAAIQSTVSWKNDNAESITTFMQEAGDNFASASQVAKIVDKDGNIQAASIVAAVKEADSSVVIDADHINLNGAVTANNNVTISTDGKITAVNANITGAITATSLNLGTNKISTNNISGLSTVATSGKYTDLEGNPDLSIYATNDNLNKNYVTNTSLSNTLSSYAKTGQLGDYLKTNDLNAKLGDLNVAYRGDVTTSQTVDDTTGIITTTSKYTGTDGKTYTTTTYTTNESNYVLLNRTNQWGSGDSLIKISKDGLLEANNAIITGTVYATEGEIGGWKLSSTELVNYAGEVDTDGYYANGFGMQVATNGAVNAFAIGKMHPDTWGQAAFRVTVDGSLYASAANITGKVTATSGSIGGWYIDNTALLSARYVNDGTFVSGKNIAGMMSATDVFDNKINGLPTIINTSCPSLVSGSSHIRFIAGCTPTYHAATETDPYITFSDNARFMVLDDGSLYATNAKFAKKITLSSEGLWADRFVDWTYDGLRSNTGTTVDTTIDKNGLQVNLCGYNPDSGYMAFGQSTNISAGSTQFSSVNFVHGLRIINSYYSTDVSVLAGKKIAMQITASSTSNQAGSGTTLSSRLCSSWYADSAITVDSDCNLKNSIKSIPEAYEIAFDNFKSTIFKYNDGTSDRYHTGFVAQEVDEAITKAGLSRQDFAALCISDEGTDNERWGLRYSEFVSLNTWQIQKAKSRIAALEEYAKTLESRIAKLENK